MVTILAFVANYADYLIERNKMYFPYCTNKTTKSIYSYVDTICLPYIPNALVIDTTRSIGHTWSFIRLVNVFHEGLQEAQNL